MIPIAARESKAAENSSSAHVSGKNQKKRESSKNERFKYLLACLLDITYYTIEKRPVYVARPSVNTSAGGLSCTYPSAFYFYFFLSSSSSRKDGREYIKKKKRNNITHDYIYIRI
jgi:hypothetical protein